MPILNVGRSATGGAPGDSAEAILLALPRPIAVVGNGRPARAFGALIDRYPSVIRFNNFVIDGFEALVGEKTSVRVTSGWEDIEVRTPDLELTPFSRTRLESNHLTHYERRRGSAVASADVDIGPLIPELTKPSTGIALLALCNHLGIPVDAFGFDGFETGHYWSEVSPPTTHSGKEREVLLRLHNVTLMGSSYDYASLYDFCHAEHQDYGLNEGLRLYQKLGIQLSGERVLEFGSGNGDLAQYMQQQGNEVTAFEVSRVAFDKIPIERKILGDCLDLAMLPVPSAGPFDRLVSMDVMEHLTENDIRLVVRHAARLCRTMLVSISTRPSGLLGPRGENLHLTVRPVQWWAELFGQYFHVQMTPGLEVGQMLFEGMPRTSGALTEEDVPRPWLALPPTLRAYGLPDHYRSRDRAEYFEDSIPNSHGAVWQPDVYPHAAEIARSLSCDTIVDIGCGHARKLVKLAGEFSVIGVDYGANIEQCRANHRAGQWLEANLECPVQLPLPKDLLKRSVVVCSDVIEHLTNPMPLLALLGDLLRHAPAVILSTPDRTRTHGPNHAGPPPNPAHTREWDKDELGALLSHAGFEIAALAYTRSNDASANMATILVVLVNPDHRGIRESRTARQGGRPSAATEPATATSHAVPLATRPADSPQLRGDWRAKQSQPTDAVRPVNLQLKTDCGVATSLKAAVPTEPLGAQHRGGGTTSGPLLTFVVAAYNAEATLQRTLGSLATDVDRSSVEVLVIDDGSTDATSRIAHAFCTVNENFRLLRQPNQGLGVVRNRGVSEARGKYVTFCDADDIFLPANHLKLVAQMERASADIGVGLGFILSENRAIVDFSDNPMVRTLKQLEGDAAQRSLKFLVQPSACTKLFKREFLLAGDVRFSEGRLFEDVEFTTGALLRSDRICFGDLPLFIYDVGRNGSITGSRSARRLEIFDNLDALAEVVNRSDLSGMQSLCLLTALMRTTLWCLDNVPAELVETFNLRLLQTAVKFHVAVNANDQRALEPLIRDPWDRRALQAVKAIWLSDLDGPQLMQVLRSGRSGEGSRPAEGEGLQHRHQAAWSARAA